MPRRSKLRRLASLGTVNPTILPPNCRLSSVGRQLKKDSNWGADIDLRPSYPNLPNSTNAFGGITSVAICRCGRTPCAKHVRDTRPANMLKAKSGELLQAASKTLQTLAVWRRGTLSPSASHLCLPAIFKAWFGSWPASVVVPILATTSVRSRCKTLLFSREVCGNHFRADRHPPASPAPRAAQVAAPNYGR